MRAEITNQSQTPNTFRGKNERNMYAMYAEDDVSARDLFAGGYASFGFWKDVSKSLEALSIGDRIQSQQAMYSLVFTAVAVGMHDTVLEIGSARGFGAAQCLSECQPRQVIGVDISPAQVCRAIETHGQCEKLMFHLGAAEAIPRPDCSVTKLISLDAIQHFESMPAFASEAYRVLQTDGRLAFGAMCGRVPHAESFTRLLIQTIAAGIDHPRFIWDVVREFERAGFANIKVESLGRYVWEGLDRWMSQGGCADSWRRNWYRVWQEGFLDYYLVTADKLAADDKPASLP